MTEHSAAIASLQRVFGNLDRDSLLAVLEVCNGDAKAAQAFLQANDGGGYDARQLSSLEGGIPADYPGKKKTGVFANYRAQIDEKKEEVAKEIKKEDETNAELMKSLFLSDNISLKQHFDCQKNSYEYYVSVLLLLLHQGVEISKASRPRILAAAWARNDHTLTDFLLEKEELFGLPQVLTALTLLDARRKVRAIEKKVARLEKQGTAKSKTIGALKSTINDLNREAHIGSVSGALARHVKRWVKSVPREKLEYFAMNMPKGPWCELADIVHFHPSDFQCEWFLEYAFGKPAPATSVLVAAEKLTEENVVETLKTQQIPYSYLRLHVKPLPDEAKVLVANYAPLDTVIWWYEELAHPLVDQVLERRLETETPTFGYGKLMERMLYFKSIRAPFYKKLVPVAEARLRRKLQLESPVVVIGDASYSMDVAIRVSTVIASVLTAVCGADLKFFTGESVDPPVVPTTVQHVLDVASGVKADGLTAPAAALYPYYVAKKVVKVFIVVTDEIENEKYKSWWFPTLFQRYRQEVYPAKVVFVSFLENPSEKGRMVQALEFLGIDVLQFKLDGKRPDLTKLDSILGVLASDAAHFAHQMLQLAPMVRAHGIRAALAHLDAPAQPGSGKEEAGHVILPTPELAGSTPGPEVEDTDDVPRSFLDPVTFKIMMDPVMTPSGHTFERHVIAEHIVRYNNDPYTREPLTLEQLVPNRALKEAVEEYLKKKKNLNNNNNAN